MANGNLTPEWTADELSQLAAQAATLVERQEELAAPGAAQSPLCPQAEERRQRWRQTAAKGNDALFNLRLTWDNLDAARLCAGRLCSEQRPARYEALPDWVNTLQSITARPSSAADLAQAASANLLDPQRPLPFETLLLPAVSEARRRLAACAGPAYEKLTAVAHTALERRLLERLSELCAETLQLKFIIFRHKRRSLLTWLSGVQGEGSTEQYDAFVQEMERGGLKRFWQEYPVLARLTAVVVDFWVEAQAEFMQRLAADWQAIQDQFAPGQTDLGRVVEVQAALGDSHQRGRSVVALTFASGVKLVYKPRPLGLEKFYFDLLGWINARQAFPPFQLAPLLDRGAYGWMAWVDAHPCQDERGVRQFYQRAGRLLALMTALQGTDFHQENLIASGDQPVLIDLEMIAAPSVRQWMSGANPAESLFNQQMRYSVLRTGLLPRWNFAPGNYRYDLSGLGGEAAAPKVAAPKMAAPKMAAPKTAGRKMSWRRVNRDGMAFEYAPFEMQSYPNRPVLDGRKQIALDYLTEIVDGFSEMHRFLQAQRQTLLADDGPLAALAGQQTRVLCRNTSLYAAVLRDSLQPACLRSGLERSIQLDQLARAYAPPTVEQTERPFHWPLLAVEQRALTRLDIPYFLSQTDSDEIIIEPNVRIKGILDGSAIARIRGYLENLDEADLAQQKAFIQSAMRVWSASRPTPPQKEQISFAPELTTAVEPAPLSRAACLAQAVHIGRELQQQAIPLADGSVTWLLNMYVPESEQRELRSIGYDLYQGRAGVALFLAALKRVTGSPEFDALLRAAIQPARDALRHPAAATLGIGGVIGLGSLGYTFAQLSQWLDDPAYLLDARQAAALITPQLIAADDKLDVMLGAAGALLALLAIYQIDPDPAILEKMKLCGRQLIKRQSQTESGGSAWRIPGQTRPLTGFSHGAAGIAYALARLFAVSGDEQFWAAAQAGLDYERHLFDCAAANWPDFRQEKQPAFMVSWCHGAPGIALSRLALTQPVWRQTDDLLEEEIANGMQTTSQAQAATVDHLCCGNFGRIDILLEAAKWNKAERYDLVAHKMAAARLAAATEAGAFAFDNNREAALFNPSLFCGAAGIGYTFLRLAEPDALPSPLLLG